MLCLVITRVAVWLGLSGVYRSSDVQVCLVDDISSVSMYYVGWVRSMGIGVWVWVSGEVG